MKLPVLVSGMVASVFLTASAASAANILATINLQEIMTDSTAAQSIKEQMDSKQKTFQDEMTKKEAQFNKEQQELRTQQSALSHDAFDKKVKAFKAKEMAAQKDVQAKHAELENAFVGARGEIQKAVFDITAALSKEKGFVAVMPTSQLLWADPSLDITKDVLAKLNTQLPKVTVTFKPVAADDAAPAQ